MPEIKNVLVVGAGTMGSGIAMWLAQQGVETTLTDNGKSVLEAAIERLHSSWDKLHSKGKFSKEEVGQFKKLLKTCDKDSPPPATDLVIEAIFEDLEIKRNLFAELDKKLDPKCIFASNTSSFSMASLSRSLSPERKKNFLGIHFFNPAPLMKLVELIESPWTDSNLLKGFKSWFESKGKKVALCKDSPGFIVNRVARNFYGETLRILNSENEENAKKVDTIMREVGGFRMGPFELMDLIGIDINYNVTQSVWEAYFREPRFAPHQLQKQMVDSGRFGRKTKQGFYQYE